MSDFETLHTGWFLLKTKVKSELKAVNNLENQGFEAYCPQYIEKEKEVVLFPGYLFLRLGSDDIERYHKIRSTRGVTGIVTFNKMQRKLYQAGQINSSCKDRIQEMLPQPIPGGDKIIEQIEEVIWCLNGCLEEKKPESVTYFKAGDNAVHSSPLFEHLKLTFKHGMKAERGIFLVQYIESQRTEEGIQETLVSEREMEISYSEVKKI
ncbi:hypothetical protein ACH42_03430 [Endozoicomonas sp. (ex Bugula neritina AB1)]|nr:hypothetical protein ACH42_03430 [Endozoicomonas sp. (ex Bugula neritina AB1)]